GANDRDDIAVGLPLPPALGKLRLGFFIPADSGINAIAAVSPAEAARSVPTTLRPQLEAITALAVRLGLRPAVFGALLWQHLTELAYLRPGSDIDLLWPAPRPDRLDELLEDLAALDAAGPARLDGEIVLPAGEAVNWRELHGALRRRAGRRSRPPMPTGSARWRRMRCLPNWTPGRSPASSARSTMAAMTTWITERSCAALPRSAPFTPSSPSRVRAMPT
ncbi:MAG: malonate decarboxylase holo-[acyl-carrier-protein] synthase, partial [Rhizobiales bacterium 35-66-30]